MIAMNYKRLLHRAGWFGVLLLLWGLPLSAEGADPGLGEKVYKTVCVGCHQIGVLDAPKFGDKTAWKKRLAKGIDTLVNNALNGFGKMPAKGGNPTLGPQDIRAAIGHMAGEDLIAEAGADSKSPSPVKAALVKAPPGKGKASGNGATKDAQSVLGADVVRRVCKGCHGVGVLGAPKVGDEKAWQARLKKGEDTLVANAAKGIGNMPPKGGNPDLTEDDLRAAIRFMASAMAALEPQVTAKKAPLAEKAALQKEPAKPKGPLSANRFNRLMQPHSERNPPPPKDGIHDPANQETGILQPPKQAFAELPKGRAGNYIDWVKALEDGLITPRWDLNDPDKKPIVMDLNIVREVKGSMPDVVYPHKQHLQWLDCSNCHPSIFIPKKGANQISMAEIILGRKCGICHGKVAFPVVECRKCHSKKKPLQAQR